MKLFLLWKFIAFLLLCFMCPIYGLSQLHKKGNYFLNPSVGYVKPMTPTYFENNRPFQANLQAGWFIHNRRSVVLEVNLTRYKANVSGPPDLLGTSAVFKKGKLTDNSFSIGGSLGNYLPLSKRFFLTLSLYAHYLHNSWTERGDLLNREGEVIIQYEQTRDRLYFGRIGLTSELQYFFTPRLAGSIRFVQADFRLQKRHQQLYLEAPILFGAAYHLRH